MGAGGCLVPLAMPATLRLLDAIRLEVILSRMITQLNTGAEARQEIEARSRSRQKPGNDNASEFRPFRKAESAKMYYLLWLSSPASRINMAKPADAWNIANELGPDGCMQRFVSKSTAIVGQ
jgi:hypothetical protein